MQVQVIGSDGTEKNVIVYQSGSNAFWGEKMDDLFDAAKRKAAPEWLLEGLRELPNERRFRADGTPYSAADESESAPQELDGDEDAPGVAQG